MKLFSCNACGHALYFHNVTCTHCGHPLGFVPEILELLAFDVTDDGGWRPVSSGSNADNYRPCANYTDHQSCNWMVPVEQTASLCPACRLNRTIPDLSTGRNRDLWQRLQAEKNRLVYSLLRLNLPLLDKQQAPDDGLSFDFIGAANPRFREDSSVMTGHAQGVITIDIAEADDAIRESVRQEMAEPYRTLLGHFRHESGHYYWDRLVRDSHWIEKFRDHFGDERTDYDEALQQYYDAGPPADWQLRFVSGYAASHPWEDWAETWAHYLHIVDTLETAWQFGLTLEPRVDPDDELSKDSGLDPYATLEFDSLVDHWVPLTVALNNLNQSMGQPDAYPFVLSSAMIDKLALVHAIVRDHVM